MATASDPLIGVRSKIEWTKKKIIDLQSAISAFFNTDPYSVGTKRDPDTGELIYHITHAKDVPFEIDQLTGDVFANMVSILDHLAFRLYRKANPHGDGRHVYFPIGMTATTPAEYIAETKRKVKGIDLAVVAAIAAFEPYKGARGRVLWVLNELNNLSKHRDLVTVGGRFRSTDISGRILAMLGAKPNPNAPRFPAIRVNSANALCPLKIGDVLLTLPAKCEPDDKLKFIFDIALDEPQIIEAKPLIETVYYLHGLIDEIVNHFIAYV